MSLIESSVRAKFRKEMLKAVRAAVDPDGLAILLEMEGELKAHVDERIRELRTEYSSRELAKPAIDQGLIAGHQTLEYRATRIAS